MEPDSILVLSVSRTCGFGDLVSTLGAFGDRSILVPLVTLVWFRY